MSLLATKLNPQCKEHNMTLRHNLQNTHSNNDRLDQQVSQLYDLVAKIGGDFPVGGPEKLLDIPAVSGFISEHTGALGRQSQAQDKLQQVIEQLSAYIEPKTEPGNVAKFADRTSSGRPGY